MEVEKRHVVIGYVHDQKYDADFCVLVPVPPEREKMYGCEANSLYAF